MNKRLLDSVEIAGVCGKFARSENRKQGLHLLAEMASEAQDAKTREMTLKEVGEKLEREYAVAHISRSTIVTLKEGKMPK